MTSGLCESHLTDCPASEDKPILISLNMYEEAELYNLAIICSNRIHRFSHLKVWNNQAKSYLLSSTRHIPQCHNFSLLLLKLICILAYE